jgi:hypothetical protein
VGILFPGWTPGVAYRAKPAPAPALNLIERMICLPLYASESIALWHALSAADALIRDPDNADLRAAYEEAIK